MPAPLVGLAIATAAKMAAKKLAQQGAKKVAKTAATRARANSAAAAKAVAPKKAKGLSNTFGSKGTIKKEVMLKKKAATKPAERKLDMNKPCKTCGMIHANPAFKHDARVEALRSSVGNALGGNKGKAVTERVKIKSGGNVKPYRSNTSK